MIQGCLYTIFGVTVGAVMALLGLPWWVGVVLAPLAVFTVVLAHGLYRGRKH